MYNNIKKPAAGQFTSPTIIDEYLLNKLQSTAQSFKMI